MIDTHCHLIDPQFKNDLDKVLDRAHAAGITGIVNAGYDVAMSEKAVELGKKRDWLLPAVGIHPSEAAEESIREMEDIERILANQKVYAIGETGLDYYRNLSPHKAQQELFRCHVALARKYQLPLLIHTRNSVDDAIRILKEEDYHRGVFHCYSGTYEQAKVILDMGYYCGFGGILTFSKRNRDILKKLPIDRVVLETDAPFLSPAGHRGHRNEPAFIIETLNTCATTLDLSSDELEGIVDQNAVLLFSLPNKKGALK